MKDSRRRIWPLALAYLAGAGLLAFHLSGTMVGAHEDWLRRSYANRWAFRDVPTKRGAIRDRNGVRLVYDEPTSALEIHYRDFRRRHPCGAAWHLANELRMARGEALKPLDPRQIEAAFEVCLWISFDLLRELDEQTSDDVCYYLTSVMSALTNGRRGRISAEVYRALAEGRRGTVTAALGLEPDALRQAFAERLAGLRRIGRLMKGRDFFAVLAGFSDRWLKNDRTEHVPRRVLDGMEYEDAQRIAQERELHPGIRVRPSVARRFGATNARWESLTPRLGHVTAEWGDDADLVRRQALLTEMAPELAEMAQANEELPEELRSSVAARLTGAMEAHLVSQGRVGRSGVEKDMDAMLRGQAGMHWVQRGRSRRDLGLWSTFDVTPGDDVFLTIDLRLQHELEQAVDKALAGRPGVLAAIAIVDPQSGDVLALASRPTPKQRYEKDPAIADPALSWSGVGFIGSLAKPLVLAEHLDARRRGRPFTDESQFIPCRGLELMPPDPKIPWKRHQLRCDHAHGDSVRDPVHSLGVSCNYYFFQVGEGLGPEGLKRAYERFGLYLRPETPSPHFQRYVPGLPARGYPNPTWATWRQDVQRRAIGYDVEANVLHMARAYCGLATGRLPELSFVQRKPGELRFHDLGLHPDDLAEVRKGMRFCVERGTAKDLTLPGVWAKTGTAEVSKTKIGPNRYRTRNNAWLAGFVGVAPARLTFACVVYNVEQGGFGAKVAGPLFEEFLNQLRTNPQLAKEFL